MVRYCEIAYAQDVHAYEDVNSSMQSNLGNAHHWKHHLIRKADVNQVGCSSKRPATNTHVLCTDGSQSKVSNDGRRD